MFIYDMPNIFDIENEIKQMIDDEKVIEIDFDDDMLCFMDEIGLVDGIDYKSIV